MLGAWQTASMVERHAHVAPEALQGGADELDAFLGHATKTNGLGITPKPLIELVGPEGFEPSTNGLREGSRAYFDGDHRAHA